MSKFSSKGASVPPFPTFPSIPSFDNEATTRSPVPLKLKLPRRRHGLGGLSVSLAVHAIVVALVVAGGERVWNRTPAPGNPLLGAAGSSGGGGGARVAYITLPSLPRPEAPAAPKVPRPVPPPKQVAVPAVEPEQPEAVTPPADTIVPSAGEQKPVASTGGPGAGGGPGTPGTGGEGQGGGKGNAASGPGIGGEGGRARPPEPRDMAFPFDSPPKELRGMSLWVTFWVRVDGRVERYKVDPEIRDRDYAKKFDEVMRAFRFAPAQAPDGTPIPGTTRISFTLPGKSSS
jgi:hypothetical protein